jgi:glutamate---cysteine ligase / carboxylate-amine ligase
MSVITVGTKVGTEHEYSINDRSFTPLPVSDRILEKIHGSVEHEVDFGPVKVSKELQKTAIELIPARPGTLVEIEDMLYQGLKKLYAALDYRYKFLGLGMHPLLTLDQTTYWDHDEQEYYQIYDRLFNIRQHGWLNIQALQINVPFGDKQNLVAMFNRMRALMPYLIAVSAASPFVEGKLTSYADNRLVYYRENQKQIPSITHDILPEKLSSVDDYIKINRGIYASLRGCGADILCREWVNSRGVIVRFSRGCLEVKAIDEQECLKSDMAITAFLLALLRSDLSLEEDESSLKSLMEEAMRNGTENLKPELERLYKAAYETSTEEERRYLPLVKHRIKKGSLAEVLRWQYKDSGDIRSLLQRLEEALGENKPYLW